MAGRVVLPSVSQGVTLAVVRPDLRIGALLILIGGVLDLARLMIFSGFAAIALPEPALTAINVIPSAIIGLGLIAMGSALPGRRPVALIVAGLLGLVLVVVNVAQITANSPLGPAPSELAYLVSFASVVVAGVLLLTDNSQRGRARWAIAIPAGCIVLFVLSLFTLPLPWFQLFPGAGFAVAGALLCRSDTHRQLSQSIDAE